MSNQVSTKVSIKISNSMILGIKELHRLVDEQKLVENLCEREMNNPEGAGFDFHMGEVYEIEGEGFLGVEERKTPETKSVAKYEESKNEDENYFIFEPGKYYLVKTMEKVNLPLTLSAMIVSGVHYIEVEWLYSMDWPILAIAENLHLGFAILGKKM